MHQGSNYFVCSAAALLLVLSANACAAEDGHFFSDSTLTATFRTYYYNRVYLEDEELARYFAGNDSGIRRATTQTVLLDFASGYLLDRFGVDTSYYGTLKLEGKSDQGNSGLTLTEANGTQHSFGSIAVAFLKARVPELGNAEFKIGRQTFATPLINSADFFSQPATQEGAAIYLKPIEHLNLHGSYITRFKPEDEDDFTNLEPAYDFAGGGEIDDIYSIGLDYKFDNSVALSAQWSHASDTWNAYWLQGTYDFDLAERRHLQVDTIYYRLKDTGDLSQRTGNDIDVHLFNLRGALKVHEHLTLSASWQTIWGESGADYYDGMFAYWWNSVTVSDFNFEDETSWQARLDYDFSGLNLPGLSLLTRYTSSNDAKAPNSGSNEEFDENEWDTDLQYQVQQGFFKGLQAKLRYARYRSDVGLDNGGDLDDFRIIVNYNKAFF